MTTTPRARHRMRKLRVDRIDLVPEGAQPDAAIAIWKSADSPFETAVAEHRSAGLSRPEAVVKALDERPDLYEKARASEGTARVVKATERPESLRERIVAHVEAEARSFVSKSAGTATRAAVATAVTKLLEDPQLADLAAVGSMPQAVLPVEMAVKQLRALGLVSVDEALTRLGL